jgi:hypothetical protein
MINLNIFINKMNNFGERELSLGDLIETLFDTAPKPPKTYGVSFVNQDNLTNLKEVFENLLTLFTAGMKILFGENGKVDLDKLSENDFKNFNKYMNSIGLKVEVAIIEVKENDTVDYSQLSYKKLKITNKTKLVELKLPLMVSNKIYIVQFDFL